MKSPTCPICGVSLQQDTDKDMADGAPKPAAYSEAYLTHFQTVHPDFWRWDQSKRRIGIGLGLVTATATGVLTFYVLAFVLHIDGSGWGEAVAGICTVAFVIPFALISRRGAEHFKTQWQLEGRLPTPTPRIGIDISQDRIFDEDSSILGLTSDLVENLGVEDLSVSRVLWKSTARQAGGFAMIPPDGAVFGTNTIYLAECMEGKLSVDEWKPLIASALNYRKLGDRKISWVLTIVVPLIAVYTASWFLLPPNGQCAVNNVGWDILIILGVALPVGLIVFFASTWKRFRYIADEQTADLVGKNQLVHSLQRVLDVSSPNRSFAQKRIDKLT